MDKKPSPKPARPGPPEAGPTYEMALIYRIGLQISSELDLDRLLQLVVDQVQETLRYPYVSVLLREGNDLVVRAASEYSKEVLGLKVSLDKSVTGRAAQLRHEILVPDTSACDFYFEFRKGFLSELAVPIIFREQAVGVLNTESPERSAYGERDVRLLRILANQIGVAIHNAFVHTQLELVHKVGLQLISVMDINVLLPAIVREMVETLHFDNAAVFLPEGEALVGKAAVKFPDGVLGRTIPLGQGVVGRAAAERVVVNIGDVAASADYIPSGIPGIHSEIAVPILYGGAVLGVLTVESQRPNAFDENDVRLLTILGTQVAAALRNASLYAALEKQDFDAVTGLQNFRYFRRRLEIEMSRAKRYGRELSVVLVDVDHVKAVNEACGRLKGDEVIRAAAALIGSHLRKPDVLTVVKDYGEDMASRYGGDEFALILPETPLRGATVAANRIRQALAERLSAGAGVVAPKGTAKPLPTLTGSFGVSTFRPTDSFDDLLKRAEMAMSEAKNLGKNRVFALE